MIEQPLQNTSKTFLLTRLEERDLEPCKRSLSDLPLAFELQRATGLEAKGATVVAQLWPFLTSWPI